MSVRFYKILWLIFLGTVGVFFVSGNLTPMAWVVFGFVSFGLVFMGMMSVLPGTIMHPAPSNVAVTPPTELRVVPDKAEVPSSKSRTFVGAIAQH